MADAGRDDPSEALVVRADDPEVAFLPPAAAQAKSLRKASGPRKAAVVAMICAAAIASGCLLWPGRAEPAVEMTPSRQAALEFSITRGDQKGPDVSGSHAIASPEGHGQQEQQAILWRSAAGLIPPEAEAGDTETGMRVRGSQDATQLEDEQNRDEKVTSRTRRVRLGYDGGRARTSASRTRSAPAEGGLPADESGVVEAKVSVSATVSTNTTITRTRRSRAPRRSRIDLAKCARGIDALVTKMRERVGDGAFVTKVDAQLLNGKEKYQPGHNWVLPDNPTAARGRFKFHRCAVVGNSGHLRLTNYGYAINQFDVVMRTNQAPTKGYGKYIGTRTTHRLINRSIAKSYIRALLSRQKRLTQVKKQIEASLAQEGGKGTARRLLELSTSGHPVLKAFGIDDALMERVNHSKPRLREEIEAVLRGVRSNSLALSSNGERMLFPLEPNLTVALISEKVSRSEDTRRFVSAMRPLRPDVKTLAMSGKMRRASEELLTTWTAKQKPCTGRDSAKYSMNRGTTGLLAVTSMLHLCKKVVLFGFGMPREGTKAAPYHYYSGLRNRSWKSKSSKVHNFAGEASVIRGLVSEGLVEMCNDVSPRTCGLSKAKIAKLAAEAGVKPIVVNGVPTLPPELKLPQVVEEPDDDEPDAPEDTVVEAEDEQDQLQDQADEADPGQ